MSMALLICRPRGQSQLSDLTKFKISTCITCSASDFDQVKWRFLRLIDIVALMDILARQQVDNVMVEGGARVITSFIRLKLVDLFVITVAPKLVGGLPVIDARRFKSASHLALTNIHYQRLGGDLVVWARPNWSNNEA